MEWETRVPCIGNQRGFQQSDHHLLSRKWVNTLDWNTPISALENLELGDPQQGADHSPGTRSDQL